MRTILDVRPLLETQRSGVANYTARLLTTLLERDIPRDREYTLFANAWKRPLQF